MLSWAVAGSTLLNLGGLVGVLGGIGFLATRLIFGLERITENAFQYLNDQKREDQEQALDALEMRLRSDEDPRTQTYLRNLRQLYASFQDDLRNGRVAGAARTVLEQVEKLFQAAVKHLEHSYHLWLTAGRMSGDARRALLDEREQVVQEVQDTVEHLNKTIEQFHSFRVKESEAELAKLREELDETMQVARRAEARMESLGEEKTYDPREFE
ncbi:MAG: hypothetical protein ABI614_14670 [Planctomycetota bacterium]